DAGMSNVKPGALPPPRRAASGLGRQDASTPVRPRSAPRGSTPASDQQASRSSNRPGLDSPLRGASPPKAGALQQRKPSPPGMRGIRSGDASRSPEPPRSRRTAPRQAASSTADDSIPGRRHLAGPPLGRLGGAALVADAASEMPPEPDSPGQGASLVESLARIALALERGGNSGTGAAAAAAAVAAAIGSAAREGGHGHRSQGESPLSPRAQGSASAPSTAVLPKLLTDLEARLGRMEHSMVSFS
ncbi:unnamed protein product, partial [Polarella glacialis]